MKRFPLVVCVTIIMVLTLVLGVAMAPAQEEETAPAEPKAYAVGDVVTEPLTVTNSESGKEVDLLADLSRPTIVVLMQMACSACLSEMKAVQEWINNNPGKARLYILSVDLNATSERFADYANRNNIRGQWFQDPMFTVGPKFDVISTPALMIFSPDRMVKVKRIGYASGVKHLLFEDLNKALL
jgi:cytochrome oxidase Cu insertion factor (SCO1/SenC/PrrC family)